MKQFIPLLIVPALLCASCVKSQMAETTPSVAAPSLAAAPAPQLALTAAKPATAQYKKPAATRAIHLEADTAALTKNMLLTARPGFLGKGYAGDFQADGVKICYNTVQ